MSIFRESFPQFVRNQIKLREALISGDVRNVAMRHLNSRSSWVRMSSSVNVNGSSDLAKSNVLFNGTSTNTGAGTYKTNEGFGNTNGTYKKGPLGFRPMPGIDNITVKNRGAYGSLREVTVNFKCWDINQLEDLEVLYMRPGYTVLVEWGWSNYLAGSADKPRVEQMKEYYDILNIAQPKTISEITKELREKIENSQGNYDAMFGKVKNYSWTARTDGGYDCTTTIISVGEVIESLKVNNTNIAINAAAVAVGGTILNDYKFFANYTEKGKIIDSYSKNQLAGIFNELYAYAATYDTSGSLSEGFSRQLKVTDYEEKPILDFFVVDSPGGVPKLSDEDAKKSILQGNIQAYITLESLCEVLNNSVLKQSGSPLKIYTKSRNNDGDFVNNTCLWNPLQVSVEPSTCIISSPVWEAGVNLKALVSGSSSEIEALKQAEAAQGIGLPEESSIAYAAMNKLLANAMSSSTDEGDLYIVVNEYVRFKKGDRKNGNRSSLEVEKAIQELQKQYEILRGSAKTIDQVYKFDELDGDIEEDANRNAEYWTFENVTGGTFTKGIFDINQETTDYTVTNILEARDDDWIPKFKKESNLTFNQALKVFDSDWEDSWIEGVLSSVKNTKKIDQIITNDLTSADRVKEAQQKAESTQAQVNANKSIIQYVGNLYKNFVDAERGVIGNIYINLDYLYKKAIADIGNTDRQEKNEISLYDFVKGILKDVQAAIGNLNSFEIYVNDEYASIIDINFTGNLDTAQNAFKIEVQNKKSVVRNYTLQSQIFPEQSSMISIAAQANQDLLNTDSSTLKAYSRNITDRTLKIPDDLQKLNDQYFKKIQDKYDAINKIYSKISQFFTSTISDTSVSPTTSVSSNNEYKNALRDLIQFSRNYFVMPGSNETFNVIIPTKLSLTLDGLGGVIIGNLFKISENALPKGYKGSGYGSQLGYIVTDISQDVKNGEWTTTIGAQTIVLDKPKEADENTKWDYSKLIIDLDTSTSVNENANKVSIKVKEGSAVKTVLFPVVDSLSISNGLKILMKAHAIQEGFREGTLSYRNNNPGNIVYDSLYKKYGAVKDPGSKFAKFPNLSDGVNCKADYIYRVANGGHKAYPKNVTLLKYIETYAPASDNNVPTSYANFIVSYFAQNGITIDFNTKLSDIIK